MFTVFAMFRKREGMSMEDFIDYYENHHSKLGVGMPGLVRYTRNYLTAAPYPVGGEVAEPACDVITEMVFESREAYERTQNRLALVESYTSQLKPITRRAESQ
jgi:hypothetical protein